MVRRNVWQQAIELTNGVFEVTSGLALPRGNQWPTVVTAFLTQANERLDSIRVLLDKNHWDSSVVLTRSLFELAANLAYIAKDVPARLHKYLKHGGIPTTREEAEELQEELRVGGRPAAKDIAPGQSWKPLKDMCCDLGSDWLKEYETFYPYTSVPTHAGAFILGQTFTRLLTGQCPTDQEQAVTLVTALDFHLRVAEIVAKTFPEQMDIKKVEKLRKECSNLGQSLINR